MIIDFFDMAMAMLFPSLRPLATGTSVRVRGRENGMTGTSSKISGAQRWKAAVYIVHTRGGATVLKMTQTVYFGV